MKVDRKSLRCVISVFPKQTDEIEGQKVVTNISETWSPIGKLNVELSLSRLSPGTMPA